jgi:hypothetical protein
MSEQPPSDDDLDPGADTATFRAFASGGDTPSERPRAAGVPFRIATMLVGLAVFAGLVWLLLQG